MGSRFTNCELFSCLGLWPLALSSSHELGKIKVSVMIALFVIDEIISTDVGSVAFSRLANGLKSNIASPTWVMDQRLIVAKCWTSMMSRV